MFPPSLRLWFGLLALSHLFAVVPLAAVTNIAGTYTGTETATITITAEGETDSETVSGTNPNVVVSQTGSTFSITTADPSSGVSVTRTGTISGNQITSVTGPAFGFAPRPGA
ncbi:MAG: hypothetical protein IPL39_03150 [Opitutaceae bacterium]|nr:hypothetical protein [Opitutaceae bacterium]